jgi:hypothetical protein
MEITHKREGNLYQINQLIKDITQNPVVDEETGEILTDRYDELATLQISKEEIVKHIALSFKDLDGEIDKVDKEVKRIGEIKSRLSKLKERAKKYLQDNLEPGVNIKNLEFEIKWTKSESVEVDDVMIDMNELEKFDSELVRIKKEINKIRVKELLKQSKVLPEGISIVKKQNLTIK